MENKYIYKDPRRNAKSESIKTIEVHAFELCPKNHPRNREGFREHKYKCKKRST